MGKKTAIEYCDSSTNPIRGCGGCELALPQSDDLPVCYSNKLIGRWAGKPGWPESFFRPIFVEGVLESALKWSDLTGKSRGKEWSDMIGKVKESKPWLDGMPRIIFVNDMSDSWTEYIWNNSQRLTLAHDWLAPYMPALIDGSHRIMLLTKRPSRAVKFFKEFGSVPANFMVGTSITSMNTLNRATVLSTLDRLKEDGAVLWLSLEPLYSEIDLRPFLPYIDWVAVGGESGSKQRITDLHWIWKIIVDCKNAEVPVFVKQLGTRNGYVGKANDWGDWPYEFRVRQMPDLL